jgi:UTP--glucose-1-phosphate uridylyltransferase
MKKVTKAVFPVAGMGSRFLPATKASPKEMMPIVDKPLIQYAVEEAVAAGITDMIFITGRNKRAIEDHFDKAYELETELTQRGKTELLAIIHKIIPKEVNCIYIRQPEALGLGHAILCARPVVQDEPFAIILADELIDGDPGATTQMVRLYERTQGSVLGVQDVPRDQTGSYGIVMVKEESGLQCMTGIVEKPSPDKAPSTLAAIGRYVLSPRIFDYLATTTPGAGGEIQLTDGIARMLQDEKVYAHIIEGMRYDCGSKLGYLKATVGLGVKHDEAGADFREWLKRFR